MPLTDKIHVELGDEQRQVRDAYGAVLLLVLASTMMLIAAGAPLPTGIVGLSAFLQVGALLITLRVSGFSRRFRMAGSTAFILIFAVGLFAALHGSPIGRLIALLLWMILVVVTIIAIGRRLRTYTRVTVQLVMRAYLLSTCWSACCSV